MGLTAHDMGDMRRLAQLALNPKGTSRAEIYLAVASLYRSQDNGLSDRERGLMNDILRRLASDVEITVRRALAERLADDLKAPHDLIVTLAKDRIEVARPLLLRSPALSDADMLGLIAQCGLEHHEVLASRPEIGEAVSDALASDGGLSVLLALARNASARLSARCFGVLVEQSRVMALLQEPLAHRTDLPRDLAMQMREWVPETLKSYLREIHRIAPRNASPAIDDAKTAIANDLPRAKPPATDSAQKLIDKLSASGQLKAGFLLRALNQGQTDLFDLGLAKLVNLPVIELRSRFYRGGPRAVALACRGVGIDRCVFNTVFNLSRQAHNMHVSLSYADLAEVDKVFSTVPKTSALSELSGPTFN